MMTARTLLASILGTVLISGCPGPTETEVPVPTEPVLPPYSPYDGRMSFQLNGVQHSIFLFAQSNGYVAGEVVLRGSGPGMENTLMLTFKPRLKSPAVINREMTGYWDLGLCIPFDKYLLTTSPGNFIRILSSDTTLVGEFNLVFQHESDAARQAVFLNGTFSTKVDTVHPFEYCIEG